MFCADCFEERAAIMEFCGGMTRFQAETLAARAQGVSRWKALRLAKEAFGENGAGNPQQGEDHSETMAREQCEDNMPAMQFRPNEEG
ncbi:MAG: hypothetical protein P1U72_02355 [Paracoccaceae bacterium]|nr:hypothetical protein [Paracoccaceae bacterium]